MDSGQIANSKAIIGAAFVQYAFYAFAYIMEGAKYSELHPKGANVQSN